MSTVKWLAAGIVGLTATLSGALTSGDRLDAPLPDIQSPESLWSTLDPFGTCPVAGPFGTPIDGRTCVDLFDVRPQSDGLALGAWQSTDGIDDGRSYQPDLWNGKRIQRRNNCYAYATNNPTNTFPQPGRKSGTRLGRGGLTCDEVTKAVIADGFQQVHCDADMKNGDWKVALVVDPGRDYHWYRQASDCTWSHKPGSGRVTNKDNAGAVIADPRLANRGGEGTRRWGPNYKDFCGCFKVTGAEAIA